MMMEGYELYFDTVAEVLIKQREVTDQNGKR